ncbi:MAG: hypothetical protein NZM37_04250 [Sandaracinaceae bacterium]|nr:hypothetical protein [Sandaracinaceae bacterium]MDW8245517.1 hypothetical protein [Sandaracinaceae bacterium]
MSFTSGRTRGEGSAMEWLRSRIARGFQKVEEALTNHAFFQKMRDRIEDLLSLGVSLDERMISQALLESKNLRSFGLRIRKEGVDISAENSLGDWIEVRLVPMPPRFAPRGAKELAFSVIPPERVNDETVRNMVACLAAFVARAIWGPFAKIQSGDVPLVEREGSQLRVDLQTMAWVKKFAGAPGGALIVEALRLEAIQLRDGALRLVFARPWLTHHQYEQ